MAIQIPKSFSRLTTSGQVINSIKQPTNLITEVPGAKPAVSSPTTPEGVRLPTSTVPAVTPIDLQGSIIAAKQAQSDLEGYRLPTARVDQNEARTREEAMRRAATVIAGGEGIGFGAGALSNRPFVPPPPQMPSAAATAQTEAPTAPTAAATPTPAAPAPTASATQQQPTTYEQAVSQMNSFLRRSPEQAAQDREARARATTGTSRQGLLVGEPIYDENGVPKRDANGNLLLKQPDGSVRAVNERADQAGIAVTDPATELADVIYGTDLATNFDRYLDAGPGQKSHVVRVTNESPDSTEKDGAISITFNGGREFNALDPRQYDQAFVAYLKENNMTPEQFARASAEKWFARYRPNLDPTTKAKEMAVLLHGHELGFALDDTQGIITTSGDDAEGTFNGLIGSVPDDISGMPEGPLKTLVSTYRDEEVKTGARAPEAGSASTKENEGMDQLKASLERLQSIPLLNADDYVRASRETFQMNQAKLLRTTLNRMGRSGSSPEAIQGTMTQIQQEAGQQQQLLEALTRLQIESQNISTQMEAIRAELAVWSQVQGQQASKEQQEYAGWLNTQMALLGQQQAANQQKIDPLRMALGMGVAVVGTALGSMAGGAGASLGALAGGAILGTSPMNVLGRV